MPNPERRLELGPKAIGDFEAILRYTGERLTPACRTASITEYYVA